MLDLRRQTLFGKVEGNCFSTCVAILFGLPIEDVPNFCATTPTNTGEDGEWWELLRAWALPLGFVPFSFIVSDDPKWPTWFAPGQVVIVSGPAVRGLSHSTLYRDGALLWDPHPSDAGLESLRDVIFFVAIDPRRAP